MLLRHGIPQGPHVPVKSEKVTWSKIDPYGNLHQTI